MNILNPWFWVALLLGALACVGGGYAWGSRAANNAAAAATITHDQTVQIAQNTRSETIDSIGLATASTVALALNTHKVDLNESLPRILTVVVPADCVDKPAAVVHELANETDRINAEIGAGLRSRAPGNAAAGARH